MAKYSYGIYLFHSPIIWATLVKLQMPALVQWTAFFVLMVAVPWVAYHTIEAPMIVLGRRLARGAGNTTRPAVPIPAVPSN